MTKNTDEKDSAAAGGRKQDVVKLAEERARKADAAVVAAEEEVAEVEAAIAAVGPGNEKEFDRGLARRAQARARLDELRERAKFAERAVEVERERAKAAERAALRSALEIAEGHLRSGEEAIVRECIQFVRELREEISLQADYAERAALLDVRLGDAPRRNRSYFANIDVGSELKALLNHIELQREAITAALEARAKKALQAAEPEDRAPETKKKP